MSNAVMEEITTMRKQLDDIEIKLTRLEDEWTQAEGEVEAAQAAADEAESNYRSLEKTRDGLKEKILEIEISGVMSQDIFTGDKFLDAFILASHFCNHANDGRPILENVYVGRDRLYGCSGYHGIIVYCDCIPEEYRDRMFNWKCRSNFEPLPDTVQYINLEKIISEPMNYSMGKEFKVDELRQQWIGTGKRFSSTKGVIEISIMGIDYLFNEKYITMAFEALTKSEHVKVYCTSNIGPIVFETLDAKVIVLPVRK